MLHLDGLEQMIQANSLLYGIPSRKTEKVQRLHNTVERLTVLEED